jgi:digeranylgeranylglycerophospholipid reductase
MSSTKPDVIIIGGGPAGAMAALHSCRAGARTLLFEKNSKPGIPVQCGEFMPAADELKLMFPDAPHINDLLEIPLTCVSNKTSIMRVLTPAEQEYDIPFNGLILERGLLEQTILAAAVDNGLELQCGTTAKSVKGSTVETNRGTFEATVVIGADGPQSIVARDNGASPLQNTAFGIQHLVESDRISDDVVELYFGPVAQGGYGWVIPKGNGLFNIGVGVRINRPNSLIGKEVLDPFIEVIKKRSEGSMKILSTTAGLIPVEGPLKTTVRGNALLVGDAAGQLMSCNGGGIPTAMICGRIAGEAAAKCALNGSPLSAYEKTWRTQIGKELARGVATRHVFDLITRSKIATEIAMRIAGNSGMRKLVMCKPWYTAW